MYELLIALIIVLFAIVKGREHFGLVIGGPDYISMDTKTNKGYEIFSTTPNTCPPNKSELDAGLCYTPCRPGYHGVGPVCWADSVNIGIGKPVGLEPCPAGWKNDGLICRQPIRCEPIQCASGWEFFTKGCTGGGCSGGRLQGRLNSGGICDWPQDRGNLPDHLVDKSDPKNYKATHPDRVDGLCYKQCPKDMPYHIPGMPYLCYKGGDLSYGRGVGIVPSLLRIGRTWTPF
jgi:hypothetical protein